MTHAEARQWLDRQAERINEIVGDCAIQRSRGVYREDGDNEVLFYGTRTCNFRDVKVEDIASGSEGARHELFVAKLLEGLEGQRRLLNTVEAAILALKPEETPV